MRCLDCGAPLVGGGELEGRCAGCLFELALEPEPAQPVASEADQRVGSPDAELHPGLILSDRYRLLRSLGVGGQGQVWHAFDLKLRVEVALKGLRSDLIGDDRAKERLREEVRSARQVVSPNVCRVFDLVVEDGFEMVSMEFVDGTTLAELLSKSGPLGIGRAGEIAAQLLAGLEAIHAAGLVHRDLKPENVMLTRSGRVVVMDFGVAGNLTPGQHRTLGGTPGYMSPEQAASLPLDARSDVYSAAAVLAEMVWLEGSRDRSSREKLWAQLREVPPRVPAVPWSAVLRGGAQRYTRGPLRVRRRAGARVGARTARHGPRREQPVPRSSAL